jgi:hypothetical protein
MRYLPGSSCDRINHIARVYSGRERTIVIDIARYLLSPSRTSGNLAPAGFCAAVGSISFPVLYRSDSLSPSVAMNWDSPSIFATRILSALASIAIAAGCALVVYASSLLFGWW